MNPPFENNDSRISSAAPVAGGVRSGRAAVVLRCLAALPLVMVLLPFVAWLVLCCADFLTEDREMFGLAWDFFALHIAAGTVLPPALLGAWVRLKDKDFRPVGNMRRFTEACRAVLLAFGAFVPLFCVSVWLVVLLVPDFNIFYTPFMLYKAGPMFCCIQLYTSWKIAAFLLPPLVRDSEPSRSALFFFCMAWLIALLTLFADPEALYQDLSGLAGGALVQSLAFYLFVALAWLLVRCGISCLRYLFAALCLFGPLGGLLWLDTTVPPVDFFCALLRAALAVTAAVQLFLPSTRRWLVQQ